jgi:hypothetical protein
MTLHHFGAYDVPVVDWFVPSQSEVGFGVVPTQLSALHEFALSARVNDFETGAHDI